MMPKLLFFFFLTHQEFMVAFCSFSSHSLPFHSCLTELVLLLLLPGGPVGESCLGTHCSTIPQVSQVPSLTGWRDYSSCTSNYMKAKISTWKLHFKCFQEHLQLVEHERWLSLEALRQHVGKVRRFLCLDTLVRILCLHGPWHHSTSVSVANTAMVAGHDMA